MKFDSSPSFLKTLRGRKSRKVKASGHCAAWDAFFFSETHIAIPLRAASLAVSKITRNSLSQSPDFGLCKLQQAGIFLTLPFALRLSSFGRLVASVGFGLIWAQAFRNQSSCVMGAWEISIIPLP